MKKVAPDNRGQSLRAERALIYAATFIAWGLSPVIEYP
jgi:hypothetical protein